MKKLTPKLSLKRKKAPLQEPAGRITNDTLAEHREKVLAGGRKFKYPVQYARHKLVVNAIIISVTALVLLVGLGWYLLYAAQNTGEFMYRVTKVIPVPVATVDGEQVRYSDYLMKYRSAEHYLVEKEQVDIRTEDGKNQLLFIKEQAMNDAVADAYARKLARELNIEVTDADFEAFLKQQRESTGEGQSEQTYITVLEDYYGWSLDEYREIVKSKLLRQKVAYAVDKEAEALTKQIEMRLSAENPDLMQIANELSPDEVMTVTYWPEAWVPKNNQDGGLAEAAAKLEKGQISKRIQTTSGDGYYYVKLIDSNETQVQYAYIHVPLMEFNKQLADVKADDKVNYLISVEHAITGPEAGTEGSLDPTTVN